MKRKDGLPKITKKEKRIVSVFLKCKVTEEGQSREVRMDDVFDAYCLGKLLAIKGESR